ncbi:MAG: DNA recombination protein RmuC [Jiangellales bacterium]
MTATDVLLPVILLVVGLGAGYLIGRALSAGASAAAVSAAQAHLASERASGQERLQAEQQAAKVQMEAQRVAAEQRLAAEQRSAQQRLDDLRAEQADLDERLAVLSSQALAKNSEQLLALAAERFTAQRESADADLGKRQQAIESLVKPLRESLTQVQTQMTEAEKARLKAYGALTAQVENMRDSSELLRTETRQLVTALRSPQQRGRWGEHQLRRVVEMAGMVEHCDFTEQGTVSTEDGNVLRPDLVVHLAGGRRLVVDAKVAFNGYLEAMEARDDATRAARLKAHARHLKTHIDQLGAKEYWKHLEPTPDFVVMFVPAEVFLNAALDEDPTLLEYGFERNVVISTPATFVALLRTVAYTWKQEALAANAREVYELGKTLYARLATMGGHVNKLGKEMSGAVEAYNKLVGSLESRVMVSARKFVELKVSDQEIDPPTHIDLVPRDVTAEALIASANEELLALDAKPSQRAAGSTS